MQKLKARLRINRGSILAVSLIILGLMLVSALSFALVSIQERKASTGANKSNQALQTANTGVEKVMQDILKSGHTKVSELLNCNSTTGLIENGGYAVELKKSDNTKIICNDLNANIADIASVKSIGTIGGNQRAVEVAVAGTSDPGIGTCYNKNNMLYMEFLASNPDPSIWHGCTQTELTTAGKLGCLPVMGQFMLIPWPSGSQIGGILADGDGDDCVASSRGLGGSNGVWHINSDCSDMSGTKIYAWCHLGS